MFRISFKSILNEVSFYEAILLLATLLFLLNVNLNSLQFVECKSSKMTVCLCIAYELNVAILLTAAVLLLLMVKQSFCYNLSQLLLSIFILPHQVGYICVL